MGSQGRSPRQGLGAVAPVIEPLSQGKGFGERDREFALFYKYRLFSTNWSAREIVRSFFIPFRIDFTKQKDKLKGNEKNDRK